MSAVSTQPSSRAPIRGRLGVVGLLLAFPALHLLFQHAGLLGPRALEFMPYVGWFVVSVLVGLRSLVSARRANSDRVRTAWYLLCAGALAWSIGIALEAGSLIGSDSGQISLNIRRALYLTYPVLLLSGVVVLTSGRSRTLGVVHLANVGVIGSAMLIYSLIALLEPVIQSEEGFGYVLFSLADLTTLFTTMILALLVLWTRSSRASRPVIALLGLSASVHAAANVGFYVSQFQIGAYDNSMDVLWLVALMLHYWAAHEQDVSLQNSSVGAPRETWIDRSADVAQVTLPGVLIIGILVLGLTFPEHLTRALAVSALGPMALFGAFLVLREWALDRHRKDLVDQLRRTHEFNTQVLRASPGVVAIFKIGDGFPLSFVSENGRMLYGIDAANFDFGKHVHPDDRDALRACIRRTLSYGGSNTEFRLLDERGEWHWIDQTIVLRQDPDGNAVDCIATLLDVTERKNLQKSAEQTQRLELLGRLAGSIAHDFNNLLTAILGFAGLLAGSRRLSDTERQQVAEIKAAGEQGSALTGQLLSFSRRHAVATEVVDLNALLAGMQGMLERLLGDDVELKFRLNPLPVKVEGGKGQIEQVVMNLVLNACEAMPEGGRVEVAISEVVLESASDREDGQAGGRHGVIAVSDDGVGMDDSIQSQIFVPFFTTKPEGTGLGLATVHGIVRQLGGHIEVKSQPGSGARFEVYLPVTRRDTATAATDNLSGALGGTEHILVVDDESSITRVIAGILEPLGYTVFTANRAEDALGIARERPLELLLTDIVMPDCNGPELARRMLAIRPELRVVYMSGYTGEVLARQRLRGEHTPLIQKPLVTSELAAVIRRELDRRSVSA